MAEKKRNRFETLPHEFELRSSYLLAPFFSYADRAHLRELSKIGLIRYKDLSRHLSVIKKIDRILQNQNEFKPEIGDIYKNRELLYSQFSPEIPSLLALGRARRECNTIAFFMFLRDTILEIGSSICEFESQLLKLSLENIQTPMADLTYLQPAVPTTFGHYINSFTGPLHRSQNLVQCIFDQVNMFPGGIGSTNGTQVPINRKRIAHSLGFKGVIMNTRDAIWPYDILLSTYMILISLSTTLNRLSNDLILFCTPEFDLINLPKKYTRKSVIMPQKQNPYHLSFIRGYSGELLGRMVSNITQNLTPTLQVDNRLFCYLDLSRATSETISIIKLMTQIVSTMTINKANMAYKARSNFISATDLAETISLNKPEIYQRTHKTIGNLINANKSPNIDALFLANLATELKITDSIKFDSEPMLCIEKRGQAGSSEPRKMKLQISVQKKFLTKFKKEISRNQKRILKTIDKI